MEICIRAGLLPTLEIKSKFFFAHSWSLNSSIESVLFYVKNEL